MSNRKGGKSNPGAGKATKKSSQAAKKAATTRANKIPTTSSPKKSNKRDEKFDPELSAITSANDLEGRGDKQKGTAGKLPVRSQNAAAQVPSQPLMYALKEPKIETLDPAPTLIPSRQQYRGPANQETQDLQSSPTWGTNQQTMYDTYNIWDRTQAASPNNPATFEKERYQPNAGCDVKEAIACGLAQTNASFQQKMDLLQEAIEANNRKTERAVGQVCSSVNKVKVNLEIVDSTLETMNCRLLEFQKGVNSGLKELTKEVGNLASSLVGKGADNQEGSEVVCTKN